MGKLIVLKDRTSVLEVLGKGVYKGQITEERYNSLIATNPEFTDKFEVLEVAETEEVKEVKKGSK